mmetsp:Transcript_16725/g.39711  ORF Transcript_16725/g.39711 Transcript_16725/m.39711 type:complete len:187 (+) Transcript_16725:83-643(+)
MSDVAETAKQHSNRREKIRDTAITPAGMDSMIAKMLAAARLTLLVLPSKAEVKFGYGERRDQPLDILRDTLALLPQNCVVVSLGVVQSSLPLTSCAEADGTPCLEHFFAITTTDPVMAPKSHRKRWQPQDICTILTHEDKMGHRSTNTQRDRQGDEGGSRGSMEQSASSRAGRRSRHGKHREGDRK